MLSVKEKISLLVETNNEILELFAEEDERQFKEIERLQAELTELPKKICKEVLKEADKCFYTDPQSETPLTRKALKVILHQIQQKYTKEFEK